jgi:hypothetical protein
MRGITRKDGPMIEIEAFSDADFAGDSDTRRSKTGWLVFVLGSLAAWRSKLQPYVTVSTTEAEYVALADSVRETKYVRGLLQDIGLRVKSPIVHHEDNQPAIAISKDPMHTGRTKHLDVSLHMVRDEQRAKNISVVYCNTKRMIADLLTKQLPREKFEELTRLMKLYDRLEPLVQALIAQARRDRDAAQRAHVG